MIATTHAINVTTIRIHKAETYFMHFMVGGDRIEYEIITAINIASLRKLKILLNIALSTLNARFMIIYIKDFYCNNPLEH